MKVSAFPLRRRPAGVYIEIEQPKKGVHIVEVLDLGIEFNGSHRLALSLSALLSPLYS